MVCYTWKKIKTKSELNSSRLPLNDSKYNAQYIFMAHL
jgi:hypothetical protein